jgi:replicative DNA helicase
MTTNCKSTKTLSEQLTKNKRISYPSGISPFDRKKIEFVPGQVVLVGSRPAIGRTMFLFYLYNNLWKSNRFPQCFVTNEENEEQAYARLVSTATGIELSSLLQKFNTLDTQNDEILHSEQNFILSSQSKWEIIKAELTDLIEEKGIKAVYLDKIQGLFSSTFATNREQELSYIIRDIKNFAVEMQVIFFISSSLTRAVERREGKYPILSDLRESGALEEYADTVFLLHRPVMYGITLDENGDSLQNIAELRIAKNRFGPTGDFRFSFHAEIPQFGEFAGY